MTLLEKLIAAGVTENYLPPHCYSQRDIEPFKLAVIHGMSIKNIYPDDPYDPDLIRQFWIDFNRPLSEREVFTSLDIPPERRYGSAHIMIQRDGSAELNVPLDKQAWHAGKSEWHGMENLNQCSLGIECVGSSDDPYEYRQYVALAKITEIFMGHEGLDLSHIPGHFQVSPGRKIDPWDTFDWKLFYSTMGIG